MYRLISLIKQLLLGSTVLLFSLGTIGLSSAAVAFADEGCTPPTGGTGVERPVGSDAGTFTYQCSGPNAGLWSNGYFTYDPATGSRTAIYDPTYSYDCTTGTWTMAQWYYAPASASFVSSRVAAPIAPNLPTGCATAQTPSSSNAPSVTTADPATPGSTGGNPTISGTGPGSSNAADSSATFNNTSSNNTGMQLDNNISGGSTSGSTYVVGNTTGGSASSGDAEAVANIANLLQATSNVFGPDTTVFTADINGDVTGDFMFDPGAIMNTGPGSSNTSAANLQVNTQAANDVNAGIANTIDVGANSGNATVAQNTTGGDATTGNARAVVNLMNVINSTLAAGRSFVGNININGNLDGDILLPPELLNQLLASTGPSSNNVANANFTDNSSVTNTVTEAVANNLNSSTASGNATVAGNTSGGTATSGSSGNNITVLNLTGSNTIGKDALLVFVNVLGKWVGMIMNAPQGSTAAELGGGITQTGPGSNNATALNVANNSTLTNAANLGITNNLDVHARSGDASVTGNTTGGNAKSGDAGTAVNVLNMLGNNLSLSDWFGVLFINVFGAWNGSFGVNTAAGNPVAPTAATDPASNPSNNPVQAASQEAIRDSFKRFAQFAGSGNTSDGGGSSGTEATQSAPAAVLGDSTPVSAQFNTGGSNLHVTPHASFTIPVLGFGLAVIILAFSEHDRLARALHLNAH